MNWFMLLAGFIVGAGSMAYMTHAGFRDHINAGVKGLFIALKGFVLGSGKRQVKQTKPANGAKTQKVLCLVCKTVDPQNEMEKATLPNGKVVGWVHPKCQDQLSKNENTFDYKEE